MQKTDTLWLRDLDEYIPLCCCKYVYNDNPKRLFRKKLTYLSINRNTCQHFITFLISFAICSTILTFLKLPWEQTN